MEKYRNILVVGGTGFIGEYLVKKLLKRRGIKIFIGYRKKIPANERLLKVKYYRINKTNIRRQFEKILPGIDCLVWLVQPDIKTIRELMTVIRKAKSLKKIVYASTLLLYADSNRPQNEKAIIQPLTDYEKAKNKEEKLLVSLIGMSAVQVCVVRIANVYGDIKNRGVVHRIFSAALSGKKMAVNGDGRQARDYIFIEDAANLLAHLIFYNQIEQKEIFNICTGRGFSIMEVIKITEKIINKKIKLKLNPPILEKQTIIGDNGKILRLSGYQLKYNIKKGLKKTYNNYLIFLKNYVK